MASAGTRAGRYVKQCRGYAALIPALATKCGLPVTLVDTARHKIAPTDSVPAWLGLRTVESRFSSSYIHRAVAQSLHRLRTEYVSQTSLDAQSNSARSAPD